MSPTKYITLTDLARRIGLPSAWLRQEAECGRIPHLRTARRIMFDFETVERCLAERSKNGEGVKDDG